MAYHGKARALFVNAVGRWGLETILMQTGKKTFPGDSQLECYNLLLEYCKFLRVLKPIQPHNWKQINSNYKE